MTRQLHPQNLQRIKIFLKLVTLSLVSQFISQLRLCAIAMPLTSAVPPDLFTRPRDTTCLKAPPLHCGPYIKVALTAIFASTPYIGAVKSWSVFRQQQRQRLRTIESRMGWLLSDPLLTCRGTACRRLSLGQFLRRSPRIARCRQAP